MAKQIHGLEVYGGEKDCSPPLQFQTGMSPPSYVTC
jgi:hypothetical protein